MSKFASIMETHLKTTELQRIRIKYDPAATENTSDDYVGYVLEEDGVGNILAIVPGLGADPMSFGPGEYEDCDSSGNDTLLGFKEYVIKYMIERGYHDKVKETTRSLLQAKSSKDVECILHKCDLNSEGSILDIYRGFIDRA
jgi:hypothetical protein